MPTTPIPGRPVVVAALDSLTPLDATIAALARRHLGYGVVPSHVGCALVAALGDTLGDWFDDLS